MNDQENTIEDIPETNNQSHAEEEKEVEDATANLEQKPSKWKYITKHMKKYPELYRSDVSIHPSYTNLKEFAYNIICRHRIQKIKRQIKRQLTREVMHFAMMQIFAIDSVRIDRVFSVGMPPKTLIVPDFLTANERRHINELLRDT